MIFVLKHLQILPYFYRIKRWWYLRGWREYNVGLVTTNVVFLCYKEGFVNVHPIGNEIGYKEKGTLL